VPNRRGSWVCLLLEMIWTNESRLEDCRRFSETHTKSVHLHVVLNFCFFLLFFFLVCVFFVWFFSSIVLSVFFFVTFYFCVYVCVYIFSFCVSKKQQQQLFEYQKNLEMEQLTRCFIGFLSTNFGFGFYFFANFLFAEEKHIQTEIVGRRENKREDRVQFP